MNRDDALTGSTPHDEMGAGLTNFDATLMPKYPSKISYLHLYQSIILD